MAAVAHLVEQTHRMLKGYRGLALILSQTVSCVIPICSFLTWERLRQVVHQGVGGFPLIAE